MAVATEAASQPSQSTYDSTVRPSRVLPRLLIVGGGMAGYGLCQRLVSSNAIDNFHVAIFGEEPTPAYDRVNLSKCLQGSSPKSLELADSDWYETHQITLHTGRRIVKIDRQQRCIIDDQANVHPYDQLVLATGSRARLPKLEGANQPGVFVYRTLDDLERIGEFVRERRAKIGVVMGGGLLGLEAAKVLFDLGLQTSVVEMAGRLMPRQLDWRAAELLKERVETLGVDVHLTRRARSIAATDDKTLEIRFDNAKPLKTDILIIAAGVIPNDELARECGLDVGPRGGISIAEDLATSDPTIHAIGECASFRDHVYGLVAPCYRMADVLASRLVGGDETFEGADESAELKLLGVDVAALGRAIGDEPDGITLTFKADNCYRKLILHQGCVVGAASVGQWKELPQIRQAVHRQTRLWPWHRRRFRLTGNPWPETGTLSVTQWPASSIVCACRAVTKGALANLVAAGTTCPDALAETTGASTACGSCRSLVCELAGQKSEGTRVPAATPVLVASIVGLILLVGLILASPIPLAESVRDGHRKIDWLWRDDVARQFSGFTLLGLMLVGMIFSLRKRISRFQFGSYGLWRAVHAILGTAAIVAIAVHTGFRLGENLNLVLSLVFIGTAIFGTLAGIASSIESRLEGSWAMLLRCWRPRLTRLHLWLFWPLPLLIAFHILSFYWFSD